MAAICALVLVIADVIDAHCRGCKAREALVSACINGHWDEAGAMIDGTLAEPWHLRGHQEDRLRDFQELLQLRQGSVKRVNSTLGRAFLRHIDDVRPNRP